MLVKNDHFIDSYRDNPLDTLKGLKNHPETLNSSSFSCTYENISKDTV